jgi:S1-C subfamily serine protease
MQGTGFIVNHDEGRALVTAAHLCDGNREQAIEFKQAYGESSAVVGYLDRVGSLEAEPDVAAFDLPESLWPKWFVGEVLLNSAGVIYGQDCYVLGYPYGLTSSLGVGGKELPIIKKGVVAGSTNEGVRGWFIDTHVNPGFSGGPLVFEMAGSPGEFCIAGVVQGSFTAPLVEPTEVDPTPPRQPAGIAFCTDVLHVLELGLSQDPAR